MAYTYYNKYRKKGSGYNYYGYKTNKRRQEDKKQKYYQKPHYSEHKDEKTSKPRKKRIFVKDSDKIYVKNTRIGEQLVIQTYNEEDKTTYIIYTRIGTIIDALKKSLPSEDKETKEAETHQQSSDYYDKRINELEERISELEQKVETVKVDLEKIQLLITKLSALENLLNKNKVNEVNKNKNNMETPPPPVTQVMA